MAVIYALGVRLYALMVWLASPFNNKARQMVKGRKNWYHQLIQNFTPGNQVYWFHVSSLGEFEQGRPLIEKIKAEFPNAQIVLTFFSPSGYEIRKNYPLADYICYLPTDTKSNARKFIAYVKPKFTVFVKYDFWFQYIQQAKLAGSKLILISGIFRKSQVYFKPYAGWYAQKLQLFDHFFLQDQPSVQLLNKTGIDNTTVCGDTRIDRVVDIAHKNTDIGMVKDFALSGNTIICGSTWPPDEDLLYKYFNETGKAFKMVIAPHDISESHIKQIENRCPLLSLRYSMANTENIRQKQILIIDKIGLLSTIYRYGKMAYIGGGFGVSIHNTLEAAVYGIPIVFGPKYHKFKEAVDMIEASAAFSIQNYQGLKMEFDKLFNNIDYCKNTGQNASNYIKKMSGATGTIFDFIRN